MKWRCGGRGHTDKEMDTNQADREPVSFNGLFWVNNRQQMLLQRKTQHQTKCELIVVFESAMAQV